MDDASFSKFELRGGVSRVKTYEPLNKSSTGCNLSGFASVELLRDQAKHCDRAHKQDSIVELILISDWSDDTSAIRTCTHSFPRHVSFFIVRSRFNEEPS